MLTHMSYHTWCPWCVAGRRRAAQHRRTREEGEGRVPLVSLDFGLTTPASAAVQCLKCSQTGVIAAHTHTLSSKEARER